MFMGDIGLLVNDLLIFFFLFGTVLPDLGISKADLMS